MIILICGLGRAGKTTYSARFKNVIHYDEMDMIPKNRLVKINCLVSTESDVVVEGIYNLKEHRKGLLKSYKGEYRKCIWLDTPIEIRETRYGYCPSCEFPFEPPTLSEGWDEIVIIRGDDTQIIKRGD